MLIGIPVGIAVVVLLGVVFAWVCYQHRELIIMHGRDRHTALFSSKNNNRENTEIIFTGN